MKQKMVTVLVVLIAQALVFQSVQAYPDRPIKLVVPSPAGGPPDQIARLISDKMAAALGQPVIVENRTGGAGGIIGAKSVATAEPDGYTLFMGSTSSVLIAPLIYKITPPRHLRPSLVSPRPPKCSRCILPCRPTPYRNWSHWRSRGRAR
jgi:tripartite-type tricarboxylate transporter receptor subunit TctC